jgi:hypothetical protein
MLRLEKDDALTRWQLSRKAMKRIPIYQDKNCDVVRIPFFDVTSNKIKHIEFVKFYYEFKKDWYWGFTGVVD